MSEFDDLVLAGKQRNVENPCAEIRVHPMFDYVLAHAPNAPTWLAHDGGTRAESIVRAWEAIKGDDDPSLIVDIPYPAFEVPR